MHVSIYNVKPRPVTPITKGEVFDNVAIRLDDDLIALWFGTPDDNSSDIAVRFEVDVKMAKAIINELQHALDS